MHAPWIEQAGLAESLGYDLVWIDDPASPTVAAAVGATTEAVRIVAVVDAGVHPVTLAEETAVADLASGGRVVLVLRSDDEGLLEETIDVVFRAFAARPFAHEGGRWRVPARLPEHERTERRVRVTPPPAQLEPTIWLAGAAGPAVGASRGLGFVANDPPREWAAAERALGPAAWRLRRVALRDVPTPFDADALVAALIDDRESWGLDVAVLTSDPTGWASVAHQVRPRVQLDQLPPGLDAYWRETLETGSG